MKLQHISQAQLKQLQDILEQIGIIPTPGQLTQLDSYIGLLKKYSASMNLLSQADSNKIFDKHIMDCLGVLQLLNIKDKPSFLDVGSGNGLPGIPIAVFLPGSEFILLDSSEKKTAFLNIAKANLNLVNINVYNLRIETYMSNIQKGFNYMLCRAFKSFDECITVLRPLIERNSTLVYFNKRSGDLTERYFIYPKKQSSSIR